MAIQKLAQEDPTFRVNTDPETGQTILSGMGELHLEIIVDRMMREFGVGANVGKPQVAYRETIRKNAEAEGRHVKQTGGHGQYGHVKIRVEPLPSGDGLRVRERRDRRTRAEGIHQSDRSRDQGSAGRRNPGRLPDVGRQGDAVRRQLSRCGFVGNGLQDRRIDGDQGSRQARQAGSAGTDHGGGSGGSGRVHGRCDRRSVSRRGRIEATELRGTTRIIKSMVPLSAMFGYATDVRSRTQGRGSFTMHFGKYEEVPAAQAEEIVSKVQGKTTR